MTSKLISTITTILIATAAFAQYIPKFDIQGHRGARGLRPENTIPAFLMALDSGVTTLELDIAITKDKQIIVSHEPWMSAAICLDSAGKHYFREGRTQVQHLSNDVRPGAVV